MWAVISFKPPHKEKHSKKETFSFKYKISHQMLYEEGGIESLLKEKLGEKITSLPNNARYDWPPSMQPGLF